MITAELLKEVHAALVLPNAETRSWNHLQPFDDVPEIEVADLVELGKASYVGRKPRRGWKTPSPPPPPRRRRRRRRRSDSTSFFDSTSASSPEPAVRGPGSPTAAAAAAAAAEAAAADDAAGRTFHTPSNSMLVEDAVAAAVADPSLDPGEMPPSPTLESKEEEEEEEEAEEAVAAMVDSFLSAGSDGRDEDRRRDGGDPDGIGSPGGVGDWTSSASPPARGHVEVASPLGAETMTVPSSTSISGNRSADVPASMGNPRR